MIAAMEAEVQNFASRVHAFIFTAMVHRRSIKTLDENFVGLTVHQVLRVPLLAVCHVAQSNQVVVDSVLP